MSIPVTPERSHHVPPMRRAAARLAVVVARPLARMRPRRLRRLLERLARGARPATAEHAARSRRAVVTVSARCAGPRCLDRSIATALLCRMGGSWPDWCTGIRVEPFLAHAWVEADGSPVDEAGDTRLYVVTMAVRARPRPS